MTSRWSCGLGVLLIWIALSCNGETAGDGPQADDTTSTMQDGDVASDLAAAEIVDSRGLKDAPEVEDTEQPDTEQPDTKPLEDTRTPDDTTVPDTDQADTPSPPTCGEFYCCVIESCSLSEPWDCLDPCSEGLSTQWKVVYLTWWASALCSVDCGADDDCVNYDSCDACADTCQRDVDRVGVDEACTNCVLQNNPTLACPGLLEALTGRCP